ncbi:ferrous iron transport protein A [Methanobrevibacter cuticularis]|uniref:Ferrous iron transport protein A n=1 Tax=Methanobrevibacter cuticularis TaxID=47311 RepID=A0A166EB06_9EURY|nr:FeoA family protein [Methanobrevibacter cuticularis]KZX16463.1 ferrous iron transport protein A [Methanobrevibacter cuticularis]
MVNDNNQDSIRTLDKLNNGEEGTIVSYSNEGDSELKRHLLGMGFVTGSKITLDKVAPLGDPIKFILKGYSICLRKNEAKNIKVKVSN